MSVRPRRASPAGIAIRPIASSDAGLVAALHVESWRSAYRGILEDSFLDGDLTPSHKALWRKRLRALPRENFGFLASIDDRPTGFIFIFAAADPQWGTRVDNLHVLPAARGRGIGRALFAHACEAAADRAPSAGLYLWVYETNRQARKFYEDLDAMPVERKIVEAPGGGKVAAWRYTWTNAVGLRSRLTRR